MRGGGDVDEEHRALAAALEKVLAVGAVEELLGSAGGGDDDVGTVGLLVELLEGNNGGGDRGMEELGGEFFGPDLGAVGDEDAGGSVLDEMAGGKLGHLLSSDEQDTLQVATCAKILRDRSTATEAMETELEPIWVSLRTFLATVKVRWRRDSSVDLTAPTSRAML